MAGMAWQPQPLSREQMEERRLERGRLLRGGTLSQAEISRHVGKVVPPPKFVRNVCLMNLAFPFARLRRLGSLWPTARAAARGV